ncbi:hypothetical protein GMOD_00009212 [Pyrenophora seminiperda CCB06]|uniref:Uncharacterized protein n=1 Tax=Pyrenophora seminiperda CCB06 TaxID=1302712 RepID=A0A3M7MBH0_9PLEO|nr:hypothetical protein GMOD_00009212 [Pyrenophora seminiperda CCB06]
MCFVHNCVAEAGQAILDKTQRGTAAQSASYVMGPTGMPPRYEPLDGRGGCPGRSALEGGEGGWAFICL